MLKMLQNKHFMKDFYNNIPSGLKNVHPICTGNVCRHRAVHPPTACIVLMHSSFNTGRSNCVRPEQTCNYWCVFSFLPH